MRLIFPIKVTAPNFQSCILGGLLNGIYLMMMLVPVLAVVLAFLRVL